MSFFRKDVCKHFNGANVSECNIGVEYENFKGEGGSVNYNELPCFQRGKKTCPLLSLPTDEEVEAARKEIEEEHKILDRAFRLIDADMGKKKKEAVIAKRNLK